MYNEEKSDKGRMQSQYNTSRTGFSLWDYVCCARICYLQDSRLL